LVEAFDCCFEEAVDLVGASELEEGAEDLGSAEGCAWWGDCGGVEVLDEDLEGENCVWEIEDAGAGCRSQAVGGGGFEVFQKCFGWHRRVDKGRCVGVAAVLTDRWSDRDARVAAWVRLGWAEGSSACNVLFR
jgi:hypothetical protein